MTHTKSKLILDVIIIETETTKKTHGECTWRVDDEGYYSTDCGHMHSFFNGGPKENFHSFCPYCGGVIKL